MTRILGLLLIGASISIGCSANPTAPSTAMGACGDNPAAASAEYPQTFLGTWTRNDAEVGIVDMVFEAHGTHRLKSRRSQYVDNWWLSGDHLITAYPSTFTYAIADHELRFTATSEPNFYLADFFYSTEENATSLAGVTWKEADGTPLVFAQNGRYIWDDPDDPFEEGTWRIAEGLLTVFPSPRRNT